MQFCFLRAMTRFANFYILDSFTSGTEKTKGISKKYQDLWNFFKDIVHGKMVAEICKDKNRPLSKYSIMTNITTIEEGRKEGRKADCRSSSP